ncbi:MAG: Crp/Fnr family transcriptional regulator [Sphingomonas sp.]|nr:Crp/Fnr family transcriptional regulator [Sphingomonas sp.]
MNRVATDELERTDEAFARNRLLATFPAEARALVEPHGSVMELELDSLVHDSGQDVVTTFFPFGPTMVSLCLDLPDERTIEVASIGQEGAVGGIVSCGHAPAFARAKVIVAGPALKVPMVMLEQAKMRSGHIRNLFCRYSDYLLAQVMQSAACNAFHSIDARAARWLLTAQDRAGSRIELTQEAFAGLLGAQRTTVNAVARILQDEGLISSRRGMIQVIDRAGLRRRACECYGAIETHFGGIIGTSGSGGSPGCD